MSLGNIMRVGLIIETLTHLSLSLTTSPVLAVGIMVIFGAHAFVWGSTSVTVRQRAVPEALQGRISSVNCDRRLRRPPAPHSGAGYWRRAATR